MGLRSRQADCWELYAGRGNLTRSLRDCGLSCFEPWDIDRARWQDLLRPAGQQYVLAAIRARRVGYVHLGPPCRSFSVLRVHRIGTRTKWWPQGDGSDAVEVEGNLHAWFT